MSEEPWRDMLIEQPEQGQRVLVRLIGGAVRIAEYDKFSYQCWAIRDWKSLPKNNHG